MATRTKFSVVLPLLACCAVGVAGCGGKSATPNSTATTIRQEEYCGIPDFKPALRQTVVIVDGAQLQRADGTDMREKNGAMIDAIARLVERTLAPRERLKIFVTPADGLEPRLVFTGCLPGFNNDEITRLKAAKSGVGLAGESYFGTGATQRAAAARDAFRSAVLGSLANAARSVPNGAKRNAGPWADAPLLRSLRATTGLVDLEAGPPRIVILSNLARYDVGEPDSAEVARRAGFAAAETMGLRLQRAEVQVITVQGGETYARDFASAFFLGSEGNLTGWGADGSGEQTEAPVRVTVYTGSGDYGVVSYPMQMRLAVDRNGVLVNSWFVVKGETDRAIPLTGALTCQGDICSLTQDATGFAQVWSPDADSEPEFDPSLPFAGMRSLELRVAKGVASGRVHDPQVGQIGTDPAKSALTFSMTERPNGRL